MLKIYFFSASVILHNETTALIMVDLCPKVAFFELQNPKMGKMKVT